MTGEEGERERERKMIYYKAAQEQSVYKKGKHEVSMHVVQQTHSLDVVS